MRILSRVCVCLFLIGSSAFPLDGPAEGQEPFQLIPGVRFFVGIDSSAIAVSGETLVPGGGRPGSGTKIDVTELGVNSGEATTVTLQSQFLDNHFLDFSYFTAMPTGYRTIARPFRFQSKTYPEGATLETKIEFNWLRFSYGYKLLDLSFLWIGPRVGAHYVTCATTINGESEEGGMMSNTRRLDGLFPVLGLEARYLLPYGLDLKLELEGVHLITRGYLGMANVGAIWEVYPNVVATAGASTRVVQSIEDNQPLNNEWSYELSGLYAGLMFGF
jgi:hypothetical protein